MASGDDAEGYAQRLDMLESRIHISDLVAGYCEGLDRRDADRFIGIWHEDATYLPPGDRGTFHGAEELKNYLEIVARAWSATHHWTTNHTITFSSPDHAIGRSDAFAVCISHESEPRLISATYHDIYKRDASVWKMHRRMVEQWFVSSSITIKL